MKRLALLLLIPCAVEARVVYTPPVTSNVPEAVAVSCNFHFDSAPSVTVPLKTVTAGKICEYNVDAIWNMGKKIAVSINYTHPAYATPVEGPISNFTALDAPAFTKPTLSISETPRT